jgi:ribonuclease Z
MDGASCKFIKPVQFIFALMAFKLLFFIIKNSRYSGDTRPCEELINQGKSADVLIHEATFEDALALEAFHRKHSTYSEAMDVASRSKKKKKTMFSIGAMMMTHLNFPLLFRMQAQTLILTHFSQRYPKLPNLQDHMANKTIVAFDLITFPLASLHLVSSQYNTIKAAIGEEEEDEEGAESAEASELMKDS